MDNIYPTITLYQPWATWIMRGWKTIETRTHNRFAGLKHKTILIHAGQKTDESAIDNHYLTKEQILFNPDEIINGAILGSVFVHDVAELQGFNSQESLIDCYNVQRFGLFLKNVKIFEKPIQCKGEMGIWYFDLKKCEKYKKTKTNVLELPF